MGIDNARFDADAALLLKLGLVVTTGERQVEAGEHRVGVLSQLLLAIATDSQRPSGLTIDTVLSVSREQTDKATRQQFTGADNGNPITIDAANAQPMGHLIIESAHQPVVHWPAHLHLASVKISRKQDQQKILTCACHAAEPDEECSSKKNPAIGGVRLQLKVNAA